MTLLHRRTAAPESAISRASPPRSSAPTASSASLIRDLSETGVLLLVRTTKIAVGNRVKLQLYITEESDTHRLAEGQVVRVEEVGAEDAGPWLRRVAVHFVGTITVTADDIAAFRERATRLGIVPPSSTRR